MTPIPPANPAAPEAVSDYAGFDFRRLWHGRVRVTEVERAILRQALAGARPDRILEVGTGFGRLLPVAESVAREVVACDFDAESLARLPLPPPAGPPRWRIAANVYHLPYRDGAFSAATLIRVYHHLGAPERALGELHRVLVPGGRLVVSYTPRPSWGTLTNDIGRAVRRTDGAPFRSATFGRGPRSFRPEPFPIYIDNRRAFGRVAQEAGFRVVGEWGAGFEEYAIARRLPTALFVRLGTGWARAPGFPHRFVLLERDGASESPAPLPTEYLACPRCGAGLLGTPARPPDPCSGCGWAGGRAAAGVLDLRYLPTGAARWEAPPS